MKYKELREILKSAQIIEKPTYGWVFSPEDENCGFDGYFELDDIDEYFHEKDKPFYVFDCDKAIWSGIDVNEAIEHSLLDWHDGTFEQIIDYYELVDFIKEWNEKQNVVEYVPDRGKIIILDQERFDRFLNGDLIK